MNSFYYSTSSMPSSMVDEVGKFAKEKLNSIEMEVELPTACIDMNLPWMAHMLSEIPEPVLDDLSLGMSVIVLVVEYPE